MNPARVGQIAAPPSEGPCDSAERTPGVGRWLGRAAAWMVLGLALLDVFVRASTGAVDVSYLFNSDTLYLPALYRDLFQEHGRLGGWLLTPAPYFLPDMPLYFALHALLGSFVLAVLGYGVAQIIAVAAGVQFLARSVNRDADRLSCALLGPAVLAALLLAYSGAGFAPVQALFTNTYHFSVVVMALFALGCALRSVAGSRGAAVALAAICFATTASDNLFIAAFALPASLSLLWTGKLCWAVPARGVRVTLQALAAGTFGGFVCGRLLQFKGLGYLRPRPGQSLESLQLLCVSFVELVRSSPLIMTLWLAGFAVAAVVALSQRERWARLEHPRRPLYVLCVYALLALGTTTAPVVVNGLFRGTEYFRYLWLPLLLPFLALPAAIGLVPRERQVRWAAAALAAVGSLAAALVALHPWPASSGQLGALYPPTVECLDREQARHGLARGLSGYWSAKFVSEFSRTGLRVNQLKDDGSIFYWINNIDWYLASGGPGSAYTFVIADDLDVDELRRHYGEPREVFRCPRAPDLRPPGSQSQEVDVYVYGPEFDAAVRAELAADLERNALR